MNKKIILVIAAIMVMGLGVAGFAYKRSTANTLATVASCCCCSGDSCPMKDKTASSTSEKMSCDCCTGDSCPMHTGEKIAAHEGMPESCPMKKKDSKAEKVAATGTAADAKTSCDCSCCNHNKKTAAAPAV